MIAAPSALMGSALRTFINTIDGVQVAAQASSQAEALQLLTELQPHLLVLDADLAAANLTAHLQSLLQVAPDLCIVLLANNQRQRTAALAAGASHALLKGRLDEQLRSAIMPEPTSRHSLIRR